MIVYAKSLAFSTVATLCLYGCFANEYRGYEGEKKPDDQVAHVENWSQYRGIPFIYDTKKLTTITKVDGQSIVYETMEFDRIELMPGEHCFEVNAYSGAGVGIVALASYGALGTVREAEIKSSELCFIVEAGHSYEIRSAVDEKQGATFWVLNQDDDQIIFGQPPLGQISE